MATPPQEKSTYGEGLRSRGLELQPQACHSVAGVRLPCRHCNSASEEQSAAAGTGLARSSATPDVAPFSGDVWCASAPRPRLQMQT